MLYFGIPLISKEAATDWNLVTRLLQRTLASVFNSNDAQFNVIIACHDIPEIPDAYRGRVHFVQVDTPTPGSDDGLSGRWERRRDRSLKRMRIAQYMRACEPGYLMLLDADDLIDKNLVRYVHERSATSGYIVKQGYRFDVASRKLWFASDFDRICGSCGIFWFNKDDLPRDDDDRNCYFKQFKAHRTWEATAASYGRPLQRVDYPAMIYTRNSGSSTFRRSKLHVLRSKGLRKVMQRKRNRLFGRVEVTEDLIERFQLQPYIGVGVDRELRSSGHVQVD